MTTRGLSAWAMSAVVQCFFLTKWASERPVSFLEGFQTSGSATAAEAMAAERADPRQGSDDATGLLGGEASPRLASPVSEGQNVQRKATRDDRHSAEHQDAKRGRAPASNGATPRELEFITLPLWEGVAPAARSEGPGHVPTLTVVKADGGISFGSAVVVAPGGGYYGMSFGLEGRQVADWFAANGVTAFVLSYRVTRNGYGHPTQLIDAARALRWVRFHAKEYDLDPRRIGMIGFSAGGHLAAMLLTQFDVGDSRATDPVERESSRPDFAILGYPAIDLASNRWSNPDFANDRLAPALLAQLAPARNVRRDTPPTFVFHTTNDRLVPPVNATLYYDSLVAAGITAELHIFAEGGHGMGLGWSDDALSVLPTLLRNWLRGRAVIGRRDAAN